MSKVIGYSENKTPKGWEWVKLKDVCTKIIGGGTPSTKEEKYWNGTIPWISSADIEGLREINPRRKITKEAVDNSTTNILPKGGIIVVTRVGLGKLAIAPYDICFSQDSQGLILDESRINKSYALIYLSKAVQKFKHESRGTTINGVTKKQLQELDIPLPSLSEQQQIVSKIEKLFSELDKSVEDLKTTQQELKVYRQAVLRWAFENILQETELSEIIENAAIGLVRSSNLQNTSRRGNIYVKMNNVDLNGKIDISNDVVYVDATDEEICKNSLEEGDILINTRNSFELVGKAGIVPKIKDKILFNNNLLRIRVKRQHNPSFINYQLISPFIRKQMLKEKKATTNVCALYQRDIFPLKIKITSIEIQNKIVEKIENRLSVADKLEETITNSLQQAEALRQSILKKAF